MLNHCSVNDKCSLIRVSPVLGRRNRRLIHEPSALHTSDTPPLYSDVMGLFNSFKYIGVSYVPWSGVGEQPLHYTFT